MKLQQLRYLKAIADNNLNISEAAQRMETSQPGVSKQIRLLEEELGVRLFHRNGKHLSALTPIGQQVLARVERILSEVSNIEHLTGEARHENIGQLRISTTHTQARYVLPAVIDLFRQRYPEVRLQLHQGTPRQIVDIAQSGAVDFIIATEAPTFPGQFVMLPAYRWAHCVIMPKDHPLATQTPLSLAELATYPIVTYLEGFTGRGRLDDDFKRHGLSPDIVLTAADADVIKTYVRHGLGLGIIAHMAFDPQEDHDLVKCPVEPAFSGSITRIGFRQDAWLRSYMYAFLELFAPHLTRARVDAAAAAPAEQIDEVFASVRVPTH
ncbi:HTH-type transcriptional regulator CysB [Thiorhodospira sibirica]|uniref:HTH-type transcriptional regulator CysB n=1 Tax=Thiorhodospira sibirica TaxID=154347 RepID=UPI00022C46A3|nr:HTH-type transcriptional regulator CysB [Thiorhodospira sibirica]